MLCPNNCEGYEPGKCPICHCKCSLLIEIETYHDMCVLVTIEEDVPEAKASLEGARSFLDASIRVWTLVSQTLAKFFRHQ